MEGAKEINVLRAASLNPVCCIGNIMVEFRPVFTHGPPGPGLRAANFQGRHTKKIEIEVRYAGKKRLSTREKFRGDLY